MQWVGIIIFSLGLLVELAVHFAAPENRLLCAVEVLLDLFLEVL